MTLKKREIREGYEQAKAERDRQERLMSLYKQAYSLRKKMTAVAERYEDEFWFNCAERKGAVVPLTFCLTKCTIKCKDYMFIRKTRPKLLRFVEKLNEDFAKICRQIEELKRT